MGDGYMDSYEIEAMDYTLQQEKLSNEQKDKYIETLERENSELNAGLCEYTALQQVCKEQEEKIVEMNILSLENDILRKIAKDAQEKLEEVKSLIGMWRGMATLAEETAEGMKGDLLEDLTKSALLGQKVSDLRLCASCLEIILGETKTD